MRAERLLSVLMLLRSRGRMTAADLAAELEVSERTVLRDIEALSLSGVPVYAERGRRGGFALVPGYRTDLSGLTLGESIALLSAGGRINSPAAASAKRKLEASLPETHRSQVADAARRILVRSDGFVRAPENLDALAPVQRAVVEGWRIRVMYQRRGVEPPEPTERILDPVGLVVAGDTWYLIANSHGAERMYRLSRMSAVEVLAEPAQRDADVDLDEVWERRKAAFRSAFEPADVVIICPRATMPAITDGPVTVLAVDDDPDTATDGTDRVRIRLRFADGAHAIRMLWALSFDVRLTVIEPESMRADLARRAQMLLESPSGPPQPTDNDTHGR
ncbi:helix-turn-helix transcriptional regulator [Gordonia sp. DT30]|uniref:helix-turn-helix transcriptional regulator n=1 Tax=unclassified Gordonia (in: high G+C Gram-positive bacteria) TaxID=2657482 RepID=UPI003CF967D1